MPIAITITATIIATTPLPVVTTTGTDGGIVNKIGGPIRIGPAAKCATGGELPAAPERCKQRSSRAYRRVRSLQTRSAGGEKLNTRKIQAAATTASAPP